MLACAGVAGAGAWGRTDEGAGAAGVFGVAVDPEDGGAETGCAGAGAGGFAATLTGAGGCWAAAGATGFLSEVIDDAAGSGTALSVVTDSLGSATAYGVVDPAPASSTEDVQSSGGKAMPQTLPATSNSSPI